MSRISFQNYGRKASEGLSDTEIAGRYAFQAAAERGILRDAAAKLDLRADDDLLEIGCGTGNLLIPLAARTRSAAGIDHPDLLARLRERAPKAGIRSIPGNFLDARVRGTYSKILIYSVVHYLASETEIRRFLDKAAGLLKPGGRLLVGDIPNADRKARFLASRFGRRVQRDWSRRVRGLAPSAGPSTRTPDRRLAAIDDRVLLGHFRRRGFESFLLAQPPGLPFAHTREDLVIVRPAA